MKTIGLSMIVKDESHVILRCLNSVYPLIDYWIIVDTGSTDCTQDIILDFFEEKNIPGKLVEINWKDFSTSRNVALRELEPHVDFGFWIDADEELEILPGFDKQSLLSTPDILSVSIPTIYGKVKYTRKNIWKTGNNFKWNGPVHELLSTDKMEKGTVTEKLQVIVRPEGNSWKNIEEKYLQHAKILEEHVKTDPDPRWIFYTAQSYRDCKKYEESIEWYKKRSLIETGFAEEIYISKLMIAKLSELLNKDRSYCISLYQEAHKTDPIRGETIKSLIQMLHRQGEWESAYVYSLYGLRYNKKNPYPSRILFLDSRLYDYEMLELHSLSCFYTNRIDEGSSAYWKMRQQISLLGENYLDNSHWDRILNNERFFPKNIIHSNKSKKRGSNFTPKKKKKKIDIYNKK